jgi:hypothetical protein
MRHAPDLRNERGIALALAVFALVIIGALVAGTVFAGRLEMKGGSNSIYASQAFDAADAGLASTIGAWSSTYNSMKTGDSLAITETQLGAGTNVYTRGEIVKINSTTYLIRSTGERRLSSAGAVLARRQLATLAKLFVTSVPIRAALTARGDLIVKGTADLYGANADPPAWSTSSAIRDACPADATTVPSAEVSGTVQTNGTPTMLPPPVQNSSAVADSNMFLKPYQSLIDAANIVLSSSSLSPAPAVTGTPSRCDQSQQSNWGEPGTAVPQCGSYFPVIYSPGNLKLTNGRGQGVLLVNGDLELAGNFTFAGIIITKGSFNASKGTNDVYGTVLANNATLDDQTLAGTPQVQFSTCAISRALNASGKAVPFGSRSWAQIY